MEVFEAANTAIDELNAGIVRDYGMVIERRMDDVTILCPYCGEPVVLEVEADLQGSMVQDCDVCCRPWAVKVTRDGDGRPTVTVDRAQ